MWVRTLTRDECTQVLARNRLARLACTLDGRPYVVPVYYAYADAGLYAFSMPGKKVEWMRANPLICALVDENADGRQWHSVVVDGRFCELPDRVGHKRERDHAWRLLSGHSDWLEPGGLKPAAPASHDEGQYVFFQIEIAEISGREARD